MNFRTYAAELVGPFALAFVVQISLMSNLPLATPVLAALTLGLSVYVFGNISGSQINPAVTIALATIRKITVKDAVGCIVAQIIGALIARFLVSGLLGANFDASTIGTVISPWKIGFAEALGGAVLLIGVAAVVWQKTPQAASGLTIGTALLIGIMMAAPLSAGILNPAVALSLGVLHPMYLLAPVIGGIAAVWGYKGMAEGYKHQT
jgi:glycerol uptake facilitator-like aquaporin